MVKVRDGSETRYKSFGVLTCRDAKDGSLCVRVDSNDGDMLLDFEVLQEVQRSLLTQEHKF